jgi:hypothetical protein
MKKQGEIIQGKYGQACRLQDGTWSCMNHTYPVAIHCADKETALWTLNQNYNEVERDYV